jgi:hypothetical protein
MKQFNKSNQNRSQNKYQFFPNESTGISLKNGKPNDISCIRYTKDDRQQDELITSIDGGKYPWI